MAYGIYFILLNFARSKIIGQVRRILIIEDDPELNRNIKKALLSENMDVETVYDDLLAEKTLDESQFGCVLLNINLPGKVVLI
ncbi:response regulator [Bizionia argentinensis JUB59]|uniref:Response regulator n=1 Tax=Bizionia argentinensis JUB59 TaxID=1046627 RepID=A0A4U8UGH2_9FLAO|nr:response regulator [Bizionia argentinensis JUB59]